MNEFAKATAEAFASDMVTISSMQLNQRARMDDMTRCIAILSEADERRADVAEGYETVVRDMQTEFRLVVEDFRANLDLPGFIRRVGEIIENANGEFAHLNERTKAIKDGVEAGMIESRKANEAAQEHINAILDKLRQEIQPLFPTNKRNGKRKGKPSEPATPPSDTPSEPASATEPPQAPLAPQYDEAAFTAHDGGEQPVPNGTWVVVKFRKGGFSVPIRAEGLIWPSKDGTEDDFDILKYLPIDAPE
jgi:hypothetical protein